MADRSRRWRVLGATAGGAGGAGLAVAATACCAPVLAPLVVSVLGVSGSIWAAGLKPYSWAILAMSGLLVGYGFWSTGRLRQVEGTCPVERPRWVRVVLWSSVAFWLLALLLNALQFLAVRMA